MSEIVENIIQLILTGICTACAAVFAIRSHRREWVLLGLFSGSYFLGDLYWSLFLLFYGETPTNLFIPDMSWYASFLFLFLLLLQMGGKKRNTRRKILWLVPVFTAGMCVYYMQFGGYVTNLIYAILLTLILWRAFSGLLLVKDGSEKKQNRLLYRTSILFCALEYAMWTVSCIWDSYSLSNPYFWFEFLLSFCFVLFIPALRKAVDR